jgi:hypothetical protein
MYPLEFRVTIGDAGLVVWPPIGFFDFLGQAKKGIE